jgi:hypothetical protein
LQYHFPQTSTFFRGLRLPERARPVGYAALIESLDLRVALPRMLAAIAERHHPQSNEEWLLLTPRHSPEDSLAGHLEFAIKWEGVRLDVLKALFRAVPAEGIAEIVRQKPTGIHTRRLWFIYEWLTGYRLDLPDSGSVKAVPALDPKLQFGIENTTTSTRHRVIDNLPGTPAFCPVVYRSSVMEECKSKRLDARARSVMGRFNPDLVARAASFLLLDDSRASFRIEGERPSHDRTLRWAQALAAAGSTEITLPELQRLQRIVIGDDRFVNPGLRADGGFIGQHDRRTGEPLPVHISARPEDLPDLVEGMIRFERRAHTGALDAVVHAAALAFGFVYVHPFEDGNGRIHRWMIHHVLARAGFAPEGIVFPVSAAMLRRITDYRRVLETYSARILPLIEWIPTEKGNVSVRNETADHYRYLDLTPHAEFLFGCIEETVIHDLPYEVAFLESFDRFAAAVGGIVEMPDRTIHLLYRFLAQHNGRLSERARSREFLKLTDEEVSRIESSYREHFQDLPGQF